MYRFKRLIATFFVAFAMLLPLESSGSFSNNSSNENSVSVIADNEIKKLYNNMSRDKLYPEQVDGYTSLDDDEIYILGFTRDNDASQTSTTYLMDFNANALDNVITISNDYNDYHAIKQSALSNLTSNGITYNLNSNAAAGSVEHYYIKTAELGSGTNGGKYIAETEDNSTNVNTVSLSDTADDSLITTQQSDTFGSSFTLFFKGGYPICLRTATIDSIAVSYFGYNSYDDEFTEEDLPVYIYKYYSVSAIDLATAFDSSDPVDGNMTADTFYKFKNIYENLPESEQTRFYSDTTLRNQTLLRARASYKEMEALYTGVTDNSESNYPLLAESSQSATRVSTDNIIEDELYMLGIQSGGKTYFLKQADVSTTSFTAVNSVSSTISHSSVAVGTDTYKKYLNLYGFYINIEMGYIVNGYSHKFMSFDLYDTNQNYGLAWSDNPTQLDEISLSEDGSTLSISYGIGGTLGLIDGDIAFSYNRSVETDANFKFAVYKMYNPSALDLADNIMENRDISKADFVEQYNALSSSERERFRLQGEYQDVYDYDASTKNEIIQSAFTIISRLYPADLNSMFIGWTIDYDSGYIINANFGDDISILVESGTMETSMYYNSDLYSDQRGFYYPEGDTIYMNMFFYGATLTIKFVNWTSDFNGIIIETKAKGPVEEGLTVTYNEISGEYIYVTPMYGIEFNLFLDEETQDSYNVLYNENSDSYFSGLTAYTTYNVSYRAKETDTYAPSDWISAGTVTTKTNNPNKPSNISFDEIGDTFIYIDVQNGVEYSLGYGYDSSGVFTGLRQGETYTVYARYAANDEYGPGEPIEEIVTLFTSLEYWKIKCNNKLDEELPSGLSSYRKTSSTSSSISSEISSSEDVEALKVLFTKIAGYIAFSMEIDGEIAVIEAYSSNSNAFFIEEAITSGVSDLLSIDYKTGTSTELSETSASSKELVEFGKKKQTKLQEYCALYNSYLKTAGEGAYESTFASFKSGYQSILNASTDEELESAYDAAIGGF